MQIIFVGTLEIKDSSHVAVFSVFTKEFKAGSISRFFSVWVDNLFMEEAANV